MIRTVSRLKRPLWKDVVFGLWSAGIWGWPVAVSLITFQPILAEEQKPHLSQTIVAKPGDASMPAVTKQSFGTTPDGKVVTEYTLMNAAGLKVKLIDLGATLTSVEVPDASGRLTNVTLDFKDLDGYLTNRPYFGSICGRFSNRIANGQFSIDGKEFTVAKNSGEHHLHGGIEGFNKKLWKSEILERPQATVQFTYVSPDGEEGYPGALTVVVEYSWNDDNELKIEYQASTDAPTVLNLTNHAYWNLSGDRRKPILDHQLTLNCNKFLPVDEGSIPTGEQASVAGTEMDFIQPHLIGERIQQTVNGAGGYDHCYLIDGSMGTLRPAARVVHPESGRVMEVLTTEPGVQLYTGNYLNGTPDTGNAVKQGAFCLEAQHLPNSPNVPAFPSTVLRPGETYRQTTVHRFSTTKATNQ